MLHTYSSPDLQCKHPLDITHLKGNIETQRANILKVDIFLSEHFTKL